MNTHTTASSKDNSLDAAPGGMAADTKRQYFEASAAPRLERNRMWVIALGSIALNLVLAGAIVGMQPLVKIETYAVTKADGGRVVVDGEPIGKWVPDKEIINYFLAEWVRSLKDINGTTLASTVKRSSEMVIGVATQQLFDQRTKDNPFTLLNESPGLVRTVDITSINSISDSASLIRFTTTTRRAGVAAKVEAFVLSATFTRVKPTTREEVARNPAGLYVTTFDLREEAIPK